jgi:hypothetical protein
MNKSEIDIIKLEGSRNAVQSTIKCVLYNIRSYSERCAMDDFENFDEEIKKLQDDVSYAINLFCELQKIKQDLKARLYHDII